jgi:hypothetical protein
VRAHDGKGVLGHVERAAHVDRQHALEDVVGVVDDPRDVAEDAGVGERDVEAAEALDRGRDRRAHLRGVGHVGDRGCRHVVAELGHERLQRLVVEVADHDARTLGGEQPGGGGADAAGAAGDQRDLVLEPLHGNCLTFKMHAT